jgi:hypothetical protein
MATQSQAPSKAIIDSVGSAPSGGTASSSMPLIKGTADAGTLIKVYDGARLIGTASVATDGSWSFTPPTDLKGGKHQFTVISILGENWGASSDQFVVMVPAAALPPAAPVVTGLTDHVGPIQGLLKPNDTTDDARPAMTGTGTAGDTIKLYDNGVQIGSTTVEPDGQWSVKPIADLANGPHEIYATETNAAGTSADSAHTPFKVDTTTPSTPVIGNVQDNVGPVTGPIVAGSTTDDARPVISGTGKAGDIVKLYDGSTLIGTVKVGTDSKWSIQPAATLSDKLHDLWATDTNLAGTVSPASAHFGFTVNTTTPATPAAPVITDNGVTVPSGGALFDGHPAISGTGTSGDTIKVYDNGNVIGSTSIGGDGKWSFTPSTDLAGGSHIITIVETNPAGTSSSPSNGIAFSYQPAPMPTAPKITGVTDVGGPYEGNVPSGGTSSDGQPTVKGTGANSGDIIKVYDGSTLLGSTTVGTNGTWSFKTPSLSSGTTHSLTAIEMNGTGTSPSSTAYPIYVDTTSWAGAQIIITGVYDQTGRLVPKGGTASGPLTVTVWTTATGAGVRLLNNDNNSSPGVVEDAGSHVATMTISDKTGWGGGGLHLGTGTLNLNAQWGASKTTSSSGGWSVYVASWTYSASYKSVLAVHDDSVSAVTDAAVLSIASGTQQDHYTVVGEHDTFKGTRSGHETVDLNADPASYFKETTAHIEGAKGGAVDTLHLTGDHQILDLTSLTGKTAAAKISGIEVIDLGGQHNTLKLSLVDVLNLGETDLFQQDGKQQLMVNGKEGDVVDLSNSHVAGLAEGEWQQHGTTQVGGVTYNVYEHSGAHTELLVQQGVQIAVH